MSSDEKECPFCFEVIKARAIKCKHCGSELRGELNSPCAAENAGTLVTPILIKREHFQHPSKLPDAEIAEQLHMLVTKCLVVFDESSCRYRLLESVRQYSRDRLLESDNGDGWRGRHLAHYLALAEEAEPQLLGPEQAEWLERLEVEHDNLRSALEWSAAIDTEPGVRLARSIWRFWDVRGYLTEGRLRMEGLLKAAEPCMRTASRAYTLAGAGVLAWRLCDYAGARAHHEESLAILRDLGDERGIAWSLNNLGVVARDLGDYADARLFHEESLHMRKTLGDRPGVAASLNNLGALEYGIGDYTSARALYEESRDIFQELGYRGAYASSISNLGLVDQEQGDYDAARALQAESLSIFSHLGDQIGIVNTIEGLAAIDGAQGLVHKAACLWGAAERIREEIPCPLPPNECIRHDQQVTSAKMAFGNDTAFEAAWRDGRAMRLEDAVELALGSAGD